LPASGVGRHETPVPAYFLTFSSGTEVTLFQKPLLFRKYACSRLTTKIRWDDTKSGIYLPWDRLRNESGQPSNLKVFTLVGKETIRYE
jgi:hypothetical protein